MAYTFCLYNLETELCFWTR